MRYSQCCVAVLTAQERQTTIKMRHLNVVVNYKYSLVPLAGNAYVSDSRPLANPCDYYLTFMIFCEVINYIYAYFEMHSIDQINEFSLLP